MNKTILLIKAAITLILPSGNRYTVAPGDYSFDGELAKATPLAPGQRWITVHPNGRDQKGVPVIVQEASHGSGVYHVVGGAKGKMNYLKLTGIKPESSYKQEAAQRAKDKREIKKMKAGRDKELGLDKGKKAAREDVKLQRHLAQKDFIKTVAEKMGWKKEELEAKIPDTLSTATQNKLMQKHHSALLEKANKAVDLQVQNLIADTQTRQEAGFVPIPNEHTPDDQLTTADLDDTRPQEKKALGFAAYYAERAEEKGATAEEIKQEADAKKKERATNLTDGQRQAIKTRGDNAKQIKAEIANIREPVTSDVKAVLATAKDAVELIKARKALQSVTKQAQAANKDIDEATEVKAYNLEVSAPDEDEIASDIEDELRTARTTAFLSAVKGEVDTPEVQLRQHIGAGAFNSINGLAIAGGGAALVDRSVVDVLGIAGAAQVLARRLHADLPAADVEKLTEGMADYHVHHYMETSKTAMQEAQDLHEHAKEIGLGEASHGEDFEAVRELNKRRKDCIEEAHKILGTALGEMEANAALVTAMKGGRVNQPLEVPMGKISDEDAIRQVRAIGLQRGDYEISRVAGNQILTVTPEGLDRLAKPVDRAELERTNNTLSILRGEQDEYDWLPQGFAKRPDLCLNLKPGVAATLAKPFKPEGDLHQSLKDYIGGRTADGDAPADIMADIQSEDFFNKAGDTDAYREALDVVAPRKDAAGKMQRDEALTETFNGYADDYVQNQFGGKISSLQRQNFTPDAQAQDALHRALADEPAGIAAYKPIGELSNDDQRTLREHFYQHVAFEKPEAATLRHRLDGMELHKPDQYLPDTTPEWKDWNKQAQDIERRLSEATTPDEIDTIKAERREHADKDPAADDVFAQMGEAPEFKDWTAQRDALAEEVNSSSLDWQKYATMLHGHENAYAAIQDIIKSKVGQAFHQHYNTLNPSAPLKLGRQVIRNNLNHLDAVDPDALKQRLAEQRKFDDSLRERNAGKYAAGGIAEKRDAARAEKEAYDQSQMGFFSTEQEDDMFGGESEAPKPVKPLAKDQRHTLGHAAERTLAGMVPLIGQNFKPGQPVKIFNPTMSGPDGIMRQRSIKFIAANKRVALTAGTGCVYGGTMLKCEKTGREMSFYDWWLSGDIPTVSAVNKVGEIVQEAAAHPVFIKGYEPMFLVTLESGASVIVTAKHRFMKPCGAWVTLDSLFVGDSVVAGGKIGQATRLKALDLAVAEAHKSHLEAEVNHDSWQIQTRDDDFLQSMFQDRTHPLHVAQESVVSSFCSPIASMVSAGNSIVFDITIGECANYFAHGMLHHNSGKSAMILGTFAHLQSQGKVKKGIVAVPSIGMGGFEADANRFMEPGRFKWHCEPGASFEDRLASYKDPDTHFSVVTHQSFRDDLLKMAAQKTGEEPSAIAERMEGMSRKERSTFTKDVLAHHGINFDFSAVDEGHGLLDRKGKENSNMSNAIGGVTDNTGYTISASADLVKNDVSEAASVMEKLEPEKHGDRAAFMRRYGVDTLGAKEALKREMLNNVLPYKLDPKGVTADKREIAVKPSAAQTQALKTLEDNIAKIRIARMSGKVDVDAVKAISPNQFKDKPADQHEAIAKELASSLGFSKSAAIRNILDNGTDSAKLDTLVKMAAERKGKPGVIFAHSLEAVANIKKRLEADGHRVVALTGGDSSADKAAKIRGFNPDKGDRSHDIMVASDAGSTGANLQSGQWLTQYDTPQTAMTHAQRQGRIFRTGQQNANVELVDLVSDHPSERAARERLKTKYALRELMSSPYEAADDTGLAQFLHQRQVAQQNSMF